MNEKHLNQNIIDLSTLLCANGHKLATAESCTGGWVAKAATELAGSSEWFDRGLVTYSNQSKHELLGVSNKTLDQFGAVSEETVLEMVEGLLSFQAVTVGVAISGIAGPGGGTSEKPVGTVWLAWKIRGDESSARRYYFEGDRQQIRLQAAIKAVSGLIKLLESEHKLNN